MMAPTAIDLARHRDADETVANRSEEVRSNITIQLRYETRDKGRRQCEKHDGDEASGGRARLRCAAHHRDAQEADGVGSSGEEDSQDRVDPTAMRLRPWVGTRCRREAGCGSGEPAGIQCVRTLQLRASEARVGVGVLRIQGECAVIPLRGQIPIALRRRDGARDDPGATVGRAEL